MPPRLALGVREHIRAMRRSRLSSDDEVPQSLRDLDDDHLARLCLLNSDALWRDLRASEAPHIALTEPGEVERCHKVLKRLWRLVERLQELRVLDVSSPRRLRVPAHSTTRIRLDLPEPHPVVVDRGQAGNLAIGNHASASLEPAL